MIQEDIIDKFKKTRIDKDEIRVLNKFPSLLLDLLYYFHNISFKDKEKRLNKALQKEREEIHSSLTFNNNCIQCNENAKKILKQKLQERKE